MICCDNCKRVIPKYAPSKLNFDFTELDETKTQSQNHNFSIDLCPFCQAKILESMGFPMIFAFPNNRDEFDRIKKDGL